MRRSLRATLLLSTALGTAAVLMAAGVFLYLVVRAGLRSQFDRALIEKARLLASVVDWEPERIDLGFEDLDMGEFERADGPAYLQVRGTDGAVLFRSPSLGDSDLNAPAEPGRRPTLAWLVLPDGQSGRAITLSFTPRIGDADRDAEDGGRETERVAAAGPPPPLRLVMARNVVSLRATLAELRVALLSVGLAAVLISAGALCVFVRGGLRPLDRLAARIGGLGSRDLSERIDMPGVPTELKCVVGQLNELLGRLETAFERERRFSADVAHELRTPLAGLRSTIEVALTRPRQVAEYQDVLGQCLQIDVQTQEMVERLLTLTRLDGGQVEIGPEPICLKELVRTSWRPLAEHAEARHLRLEWRLADDGVITSDAALLGLVIRNILENAVVHVEEGGTVAVETALVPNGAEIRVTNSGSELSQEEVGLVFDRFWRGDAARTGTGTHCGLGLAVVARAIDALGGSVHVRSAVRGDFAITVAVPGAAPGRARGEADS